MKYLQIFSLKALSVVALFGVQLFVAKSSSVEVYGAYNYVMSMVTIGSLFIIWGGDRLALKKIPIFIAEQSKQLSREFVGKSLVLVVVNTVVAIPLCYYFLSKGELLIGSTFVFSVCLLLVFSVLKLNAAIARATNRVLFAEAITNLVRPMIFIVLFGAGLLFQMPVTVGNVALFLLASFAAATVIIDWSNQKFSVGLLDGSKGLHQIKKTYVEGVPYLFIGIGFPLLTSMDIILVGILGGVENVGIYAASSKVVSVVAMGLVAVNLLLGPKISKLHNTGSQEELQREINANNLVALLFVSCTSFFLLFFGVELLGFFGPEYKSGLAILHVLVAGQLVNTLCGPVNLVASLVGLQSFNARLLILVCGLEFLSAIYLYDLYGVVGVAASAAVALSFVNIVLAYKLWRSTGLHSGVWGAYLCFRGRGMYE